MNRRADAGSTPGRVYVQAAAGRLTMALVLAKVAGLAVLEIVAVAGVVTAGGAYLLRRMSGGKRD